MMNLIQFKRFLLFILISKETYNEQTHIVIVTMLNEQMHSTFITNKRNAKKKFNFQPKQATVNFDYPFSLQLVNHKNVDSFQLWTATFW